MRASSINTVRITAFIEKILERVRVRNRLGPQKKELVRLLLKVKLVNYSRTQVYLCGGEQF